MPLHVAGEVFAGVTACGGGDGLGRAGGDDGAAAVAPFGAEVDNPVGAVDDVQIVFDDDDGVARVAQIARMASDIALLEDDIARVADARALAQGNRRRVNNNFRLTVGLNSAILTAAAFGWLRPVSTSMLHNGSTIGILLHALLGAGAGRRAARAGDAAGVRGVTLRRAARCIP